MPATVFISYSHKDEDWKDRLVTHLGVLEEQNLLRTWNDRKLQAGELWLEGIQHEIDGARVAVLLISANSLTSKFILNQEVPRFLELWKQAGMTILPVIVKDCAWKKVPWLSQLQVRPRDGKPLALRGVRIDSELTAIAEEILEIVDRSRPGLPAEKENRSGANFLPSLHQIPAPPADFTGRREDLAALKAALTAGGAAAIFGLQGMGGVGKTALAQKLAEELEALYPHAQVYLDLKGLDPQPLTAAQAMAYVVRSLHPEARLPESEPEISGLYRSVLHGKRTLLLMDNARDRGQVEPLIPPAGSLLLVTSRFRFTIPGLVVRDLDELPEDDARALLLRIAPRTSSAATEIARFCGRLPLALRLAGRALAERPNLSPSGYIRRLKMGRELDPVESSLNVSYQLLSSGQRRLWRLLAAFPGTFDASGAAAVWDVETDPATDILTELVRSSLVEWDKKEKRYRLHDLARSFADRSLESAERDVARKRWEGYHRGSLGLSFMTRGEPRIAIELYFQALAINREIGDRRGEANALNNLGAAYAGLGDHQRAIELYEQALAIDREIGDRRGEGNALNNLGTAYADLGDHQRAIELYEQALVIDRQTGDRRGEGQVLGNLGNAYSDLGEPQRAVELHEQALAIDREIGDRRGEAADLGNLGISYKNLGEPRRAIELYEQQLAITQEIGDRLGEANASWNLGREIEKAGELERAVALMQVCVDYLHTIGNPDAEKFAAHIAAVRARIA